MSKSKKRNPVSATPAKAPLSIDTPTNDQPRQKTFKLPVLLLDKDQRKNKGTLAEQLRVVAHAEDGKDHVNLSVRAATHVGRVSCIDHRTEYYIPYLGDFDSARAFACWVTTQREEFRFKPPAGQLMGVQPLDYKNLLLFAKYFQMCALSSTYHRNRSLLSLPWVSYTQLELSKIRQYHRWTEYPDTLRTMARHIVNGGMKESPCPYFNPAILKSVNKYLALIAERQGLPFTPYEEMQGKHRAEKPKQTDSTAAADEEFAKQLDAEQGITEADLPTEEKPIDMNELRDFGKALDREIDHEETFAPQADLSHVQV